MGVAVGARPPLFPPVPDDFRLHSREQSLKCLEECSMRRFVIASVFFGLLFVAQSFCQSGAVIPQGGVRSRSQS